MDDWTPSLPKSWFAFLIGAAAGLLLFVPIAMTGLAFERFALFVAGLSGAAMSWFGAAAMGIFLAVGIARGRYRDLQPTYWRDQVW